MQLTLAVVCTLVVGSHAYSRWIGATPIDNYWTRSCGNGQAISHLWSSHHPQAKDRTWNIYCRSGYSLNDNSATWSGWVNHWDGVLDFKCGDNKAMIGARSTHSNHKEDRAWQFQCKTLQSARTTNCQYSHLLNNWNEEISYMISANINKVLNGLYSTHSNIYYHEDRRWKGYTCDVCSTYVTWGGYGPWSVCSKSCTPARGSPGTRSRTRPCNSRNAHVPCAGLCGSSSSQTEQCKQDIPCLARVDGRWSCWSPWSACSSSCGNGKRTRTRACNNPTPQVGGANCAGPSSETKDCMAAKFAVFVSSVISGSTLRTISGNTSQSDCTKACAEDSNCKSIQYGVASELCVLKKVSRSSGGQLSEAASHQGQLYMERYCLRGDDHAETVERPAYKPFSDQCHTSNCYSVCGESRYGNEIRSGESITLRGIRVDLHSKLSGIPSSAKLVKVHAQTVILTKNLNIQFNLEIIARQVYFPPGVRLSYNNQVFAACKEQTLYPECNSGRAMKLRSYYNSGYVDIYAEGISIPEHSCSSGRIIANIPKQDPQALHQAIACSQVLRMYSTTGYTDLADNILSYVMMVSNDQSAFPSSQEATSIGGLAAQLRSEMKLQSKSGTRYLPILSQSSYSIIMNLYSEVLGAYNQRYTTAFDSKASTQSRLDNLQAMVDIASKTKEAQQKRAENAAASLQESTLTLKKLRAEFDKASKKLESARRALERGIERYKRKMIAKSVFGFFNVVGQLFKSVAKIVVGAFTGNVAMVISGVGDLLASVAELAILIQDTIKLANTIKEMMSFADSLGTLTASLSVPDNSQAILLSVEEASECRTKIVVWENIKNTADIKLGSGRITEVDGSDVFRQCLSDLSNYGKALSEEVLNHAELTRSYIIETMALEVATAKLARLKTLMTSAKALHRVSEELLAEASAQVADVQIGAIKTMVDYCNTKFFYNFRECSSDFKFKLSDSLNTMKLKVARMAAAHLSSAEVFGSSPPGPFVATHVLTDLDKNGCTNPARCPITVLKQNRQLQFTISTMSPNLKVHQRARVSEIRVFFKGQHFRGHTKRMTIRIANTGVIRDQYESVNYTFSSVGRVLTHTFDYVSHTTTDYACVHSSIASILSDLTPFGEWTLEIRNPDSDVDLSGVTQVELYFLGNSIEGRSVNVESPHTLHYSMFGDAELSGPCMKNSRKKRSLESIQSNQRR